MRAMVGLRLDGATLASVDERGGLGTPTWGPVGLLRDLELRMGLPVVEAPAAVRVHQYAARMASLVATATTTVTESFYARSFGVDPLGTAEMVLAWRDGLIESGWEGAAVPGGGARLEAFAALEAMGELPLLAGAADRLAAVETEVALRGESPYAELTFADERRSWPRRWQRIFEMLAARGTRIAALEREAHGADPATDLGRLQALMVAGEIAAERGEVRGDGSLMLLRAATTLEAADAVAAVIRDERTASVAVIRPAQAAVLDDALAAHGAGALGVQASSRWRAPLQLLPLGLELLFEPCDPRRVLELLGLAVSPFAHNTRYMMARALNDAPGIGDIRWRSAKERLHERLAGADRPDNDHAAATMIDDLRHEKPVAQDEPDARTRADRQVALVEEWFESTRYDARDGAPKAAVVAVATRVRDWLRLRIARGGDGCEPVAFAQCEQVIEILAGDPRDRLDRLAVHQLLDAVTAAGAGTELTVEQVGRVDHVDHPGALLRPRDVVIWWHFAADTARPPHRARWRRTELDALAACGVVPVEPTAVLAEETRQWRAAVLAARQQLILVLPETDRGERLSPHPLWDEVVARLRLGEEQIARITATVAELRARSFAGRDLAIEELPALPLPPARAEWRVPAGVIGAATSLTPGSIEDLLGCPLRWVLGHAASLRAGSVASLPEGALLNGKLGHRVVQALVESGELVWTRAEVARVIEDLLPGVAASLLQPGMTFELHQLRQQLARAVEALGELIRGGDLIVASTEEEITGTWLGAELSGRLDLRLQDRAGRDLVLDLKWGNTRYRKLMTQGRTVQLAVYAQARKLQTGAAALPAAGYFSLSRGRLLTTAPAAFGAVDGVAGVDGPTLEDAVARIAATVPEVQQTLAGGVVHVTGVERSRPLLEMLDVPAAERGRHFDTEPGEGCQYCRFGAVCGRVWEPFA